MLLRRDARLARRADQAVALQHRWLEVLGRLPVDWVADLGALEAEARWRGVSARGDGAAAARAVGGHQPAPAPAVTRRRRAPASG